MEDDLRGLKDHLEAMLDTLCHNTVTDITERVEEDLDNSRRQLYGLTRDLTRYLQNSKREKLDYDLIRLDKRWTFICPWEDYREVSSTL